MASTPRGSHGGLSLPKGGGALTSLPTSLRAGTFAGGVEFSLPVPTTPSRGFAPSLSLDYASGSGNGDFGIGFGIATASVRRLTTTGVPTYTERDAFVLAGVGRLTPEHAAREHVDEGGTTWTVRAFVPCLEGALARIEQWTDAATDLAQWRVTGADDTTSVYGASSDGRVANPDDPSETFEWLLEESVDRHGNRIVYRYEPEDGAGVNAIFDQGRDRRTRRYPARVEYGNYRPDPASDEQFAFEVVFDHGEYDLEDLSRPGADPLTPVRPWPVRPDPFSTYIAGFEIRTYRRCQGVMLFHRFPAELGALPCLVRALRLTYDDRPTGSLLRSAIETGYRRREDGSYGERSLPAVELGFSRFDPPPAPRFRRLRVDGAAAMPGYLARPGYEPVDLNGEGLPGFLYSDDVTTLYYEPLGDGTYAAPERLPTFPAGRDLAQPQVTLEDLAGTGAVDLVVTSTSGAGYFARELDGTWSGFRPFAETPTALLQGTGELADVDGNGRADLLVVGAKRITCYPSSGRAGFGSPRTAARPPGFPRGDANPVQLVTFAGMFGDGLTHRVAVSDGDVRVWPSLGRGRFGSVVRMANAPSLSPSTSARRMFFADVDGSGTADLVVAHPDRLEIHLNQSGNGFADPYTVPLPFTLGALDQLSFADVGGDGTASVVLTRAAPRVEHWHCELAAGKPYLLVEITNNLGARTTVGYASSTRFALADKRAGRPWVTRLPFPVQVVERVATTDEVSGLTALTRYAYHGGYFDPVDREFRGFACVERWEGEPLEQAAGAYVTPTHTRTWYETGAFERADAVAAQSRSEWFSGDPEAYAMPAGAPDAETLERAGPTLRQAYAALAGQMIRSEVYGAGNAVPYIVSAWSSTVRVLQPATATARGSFSVQPRESIRFDYECDASDPRIEHSFLLRSTLFDDDGADTYAERRCSIAYPRRTGTGPRAPEQDALAVTVSSGRFTRVTAGFRMIGVPFEEETFELGGVPSPARRYFSFAEIDAVVATALTAEIPYGAPFAPPTLQSRPLTRERSLFWDDAQTAVLPLGSIGRRALLHHAEHAAFSDAWLAAVYAGRVDEAALTAAGYGSDGAGAWWARGPTTTYYEPDEPDRHFLPCAVAGEVPYTRTTTGYDAPYALFATRSTEFVDPATTLTTAAEIDYQAARAWQLTDPNGVQHQVLFDPLGSVLASGRRKPATGPDPWIGDGDLRDYVVQAGATFDAVLANREQYLQEAGAFYFYDLDGWRAEGQPGRSIALAGTVLASDSGPGPIAAGVAYADGLGRAAEYRQEAAPSRWIVSGRTVYDRAGNPSEEYLPAYSDSPRYGAPPEPPDADVPPRVIHYDALGRVVRVDTPKGFFSTTVRTAWEEVRSDENDTVLDSAFYAEFMSSLPPQPTPDQLAEKDALEKAARCFNTPARALLDPFGHPVRRVEDGLGSIPADSFAAIVSGSGITSEQLWDELHAKQYLVTSTVAPVGTWLTDAFQPYAPGFVLELDPPYDQFARQVGDYLRRGRLTSFAAFDGQGRTIAASDPRLFFAAVHDHATAVNVAYAYAMGSETAVLTASVDAGSRWILEDTRAHPVQAWDSRGQRLARTYDGLGRLLSTTITDALGSTRTCEVLTYGEGQPGASAANLNGRLYELEDEAGIETLSRYDLDGRVLEESRQLARDVTTEPDWALPVVLLPEVYATASRYDALGRMLAKTSADGSTSRMAYDPAGRTTSIDVVLADGAVVPFVDAITYRADGSRLLVTYAGGWPRQSHAYEDTTGRLARLVTARSAAGEEVQRTAYTYDPVGNVTLTRDATPALVFGAGAEARSDFVLDPLYRLRSATGVQAPGIGASTYVTGFKQSVFLPLGPDPRLETYSERYTYDDSGNLVGTEHAAASGSYTRSTAVLPGSNRLQGTAYDGNGNALTLDLGAEVALTWDHRNNVAAVGPVPRPAATTQTWSTYDFGGDRARRSVERRDASGTLVETTDRRYLDNLVVELVTDAGGVTTASETLRLSDGSTCMALARLDDGTLSVRYQLDDRLGSVSVELDRDAAVRSYEAFLPYGGSALVAGPSEDAVAPKVYRYTGKECDDESALYYYGARYLCTWTGRWLSPDPSGAIDGLNLYAYVNGNPVTLRDADGHNGDKPSFDPFAFYRLARAYLQRAAQPGASAFMLSIFNSPRRVFTEAPAVVHRSFYGAPPEQLRAQQARAALAEETRLIVYHSLIAGGVSSGSIPSVLHPLTRPWSTVNVPFYGVPLQVFARLRATQPETHGTLLGSVLGGMLTTGAALGMIRGALVFRAPLLVRALTLPLPFVASLSLNVIGLTGEIERSYQAQQQRLREGSYWQRLRTNTVGYVSGVPRIGAFVEDQKRQRDAAGPVSPTQVLGVAVALYATAWAIRRGSFALFTQLTRQPPPVARSTALVVYQPRVTALVPTQKPPP